MKETFKLSTIALLAAMLVATPSGAVSLNLGGGGGNGQLLDLSGDGDAVVEVNTGGLLGGGDADANAALDTIVHVGPDSGSTDALVNVDLGGSAGGTGDGGLLDLGGTGGGLLDLGGSGDIVDLGDTGDLIDLGGTGTGPGSVKLDLNGDDDAVLLDLFGTDGDPEAVVKLGSAGLGGLDIFDGGSATDGALIDLFGPRGAGGNGGGGAGGNGTGSGNGGNGGSGGAGGNGGTGISGGSGGLLVASTGRDARCFTPSSTQIGNLVNRHTYTAASLSAWVNAQNMKIVEVGLCTEAKQRLAATLAADANIARLQSHLNAHAVIRAGLSQRGHSANDVIAVDRSGGTLIVYVI